MPVGVGIGCRAVDMRHTGIIGVGIAVHAEQPLSLLALRHQPGGADEAALEVHRPIVKAKPADMAVAVEAGQPLVLRRTIVKITLHPIERAVDVGGDLAPDLTVVHVRVESGRAVEAWRKERMTSEIDSHGDTPE